MPPDQFEIDINDQISNVYLIVLAIRFENLQSTAVMLVFLQRFHAPWSDLIPGCVDQYEEL